MSDGKVLEAARPADGQVVTKAVVRAAERLGISNRLLGSVIGLSDETVSGMTDGSYALDPASKHFELALILVRIYRSLDTMTGGDDATSSAWLKNANEALGGTPLDLVQSVPGMMNVLTYLDARRAIV